MKVIEIEELKNVNGYKVMDYEAFDSVVEVAGHYVKTIEPFELDEAFRQGFYDYICEAMQDTINTYVEQTDEETIYTHISGLMESVDLPDCVQPFNLDVYVELDSKCKSLYHVKGDIPDYKKCYDKLLNQYKDELVAKFNKSVEEFKLKQEELENKSRSRQLLLETYKQSYKDAPTTTKKTELVGQLKVKLAKEFDEKLSKDEIIYELEN